MADKNIRTVELQLLRHGPAYNQLLSPLTDYLALCGDHPNTTLNFPLEHESLKVRLRALRYEDSDETRRAQLRETAHIAASVLATVPGLISDLGRYKDGKDDCVHLSIATSAAELALFPFELADSPPGFPGSGGPLCLQTQLPICLTRRSRNVRSEGVQWNVPPRILLIASDAGGPIPLERHYALLRKLVDPWVRRVRPDDPNGQWQSKIRERLEVLPDATVQSIEKKMNEKQRGAEHFTHVHILAHGSRLPDNPERFGVALHDPTGRGIDVVDGARLGRLLGTRLCSDATPRPNVVTLAVCDSGNQGFNVAVPGASIAFELHEADIPLVVGSQFPLAVGGSIVLVETLYGKLLAGCDPRKAVWETRRALFARNVERLTTTKLPGRHDWCSMVAFAAFPHNISDEVKLFEQLQRRTRMDFKLAEGDKLLDQSESTAPLPGTNLEQLKARWPTIESEVVRFNRWLDTESARHDEWFSSDTGITLYGVAASANKRLAELLDAKIFLTDADKPRPDLEVVAFVRKSLRIYARIAEADRNQDWAFVQKLFLRVFLTLGNRSRESQDAASLVDDWFEAKYLCCSQERSSMESSRKRTWQLSNMIELGLLGRLIISLNRNIRSKLRAELEMGFDNKKLDAWCDELAQMSANRSNETFFDVYSGRRQILRYDRFAQMFNIEFPNEFKRVYAPIAKRVRQEIADDERVYLTSR